MRWRLIKSEKLSPVENMAVDRILFENLSQSNYDLTLRFYQWTPPALSLGYFQAPDEVLKERLDQDGIILVRRITGGRAVLHSAELTYALIAKNSGAEWCAQMESVLQFSANWLKTGLNAFGVMAETLVRSYHGAAKSKTTAPCFMSPSSYETGVQGKKLVGSAQRRSQHGFLQHGSIPLDNSHLRIVNYLNYGESEREAILATLSEASISLEQVLGYVPDPLFLERCLTEAFINQMGAPFSLGLETQEATLADQLITRSPL
jgi:lipoate-protein ligase A